MANMKIEEVEGIGPAFGDKLSAAGIVDTDALLKRGCQKKGRQELAEETGISEKQILGWCNAADLCRVSGIGSEYSELLECSGVDSVPELAQRNAANLAAKLAEVNEEKKLTRKVPTESQVEGWIEQAKGMDRLIEH